MARSYESTDRCALNVLDTADIVRDAIFRQQPSGGNTSRDWACNNTSILNSLQGDVDVTKK
jgi:hypothetical protein